MSAPAPPVTVDLVVAAYKASALAEPAIDVVPVVIVERTGAALIVNLEVPVNPEASNDVEQAPEESVATEPTPEVEPTVEPASEEVPA